MTLGLSGNPHRSCEPFTGVYAQIKTLARCRCYMNYGKIPKIFGASLQGQIGIVDQHTKLVIGVAAALPLHFLHDGMQRRQITRLLPVLIERPH